MNTQIIGVGRIAEKVNREAALESSNLVQRARAVRGEARETEAEEHRRYTVRQQARFIERISAVLGVSLTPAALTDWFGFPAAVIDGLTFRAQPYPDYNDLVRLVLVRECTKGCGEPFETYVDRISELADALDQEPRHESCPDEEPPPGYVGPFDRAEQAIAAVEAAATALGEALSFERNLEDSRPQVKVAAIARLMQTEDPLMKKPYSASSAEKVVELDPEYSEYRLAQSRAVIARMQAEGAYAAAKFRAQLALAQLQENR